jgi:hypothetical protein
MTDVEPREIADDVQEPAENVDEPLSPEPTDEVAPEGVDEPPAAGFSEAVLARARNYGLSQDDMAGMDEARAERLFSSMDRRIMQPQPQPQRPGTGQPPAMMSDEYVPFKFDFGDDLDESMTKPLQSFAEHFNAQMQTIHGFRRQAAQELQAMNILREFSDFDRFLSGLGDDWNADYGSGSTMEMDPQSGEFQKRLEVFHGAKSLLADAQRRKQRMSVSDALTRSHRAVHWDRIAEHERNKLDGKIDRRRKGFAERPVKGKPPAMSPRDEAIAAWK